MIYQSFKDKHAGSKIIVIGLGESAQILSSLDLDPCIITIGVNDIGRLINPTYTVVVNDKLSFKEDRWKHIELMESEALFTHIKNVADQMPVKHQDRVVTVTLGRYAGTDLHKVSVDFTSNSPYVAVIIAAWMGAKHIGLLGVDWTPNHFFAKSGDHPLTKKIHSIVTEYNNLAIALKAKDIEIYNLSPVSRLGIPKMHINDFLSL